MINTILKSTAVLGLVTLGIGAAVPVVANADEVGSIDTTAGITFTPTTDPTSPITPTDPDNPGNTGNPDKPVVPLDPEGNPDGDKGTNGPLSLDYASNFDFGVQKVTSRTVEYPATAQMFGADEDGNTPDPSVLFAQVSDNRGTANGGWTLTVKQNGQFKDAKKNELTGAAISIKNLSAATQANATSRPAMPGADITNLDPTGADAPVVMSAEAGAGQGTWVARMGNLNRDLDLNGKTYNAAGKEITRPVDNAVTLNVPGYANKMTDSAYTTKLTWSLNTLPENEQPTTPETEQPNTGENN